MINQYEPEKPTVKLYYSDKLKNPQVIDQILYGAEEEGIPVETKELSEDNVLQLAYAASRESRLGTGIGVSAGGAAVQYGKLPVDKPLYIVSINSGDEALRRVGCNGARLVKRMPLRMK